MRGLRTEKSTVWWRYLPRAPRERNAIVTLLMTSAGLAVEKLRRCRLHKIFYRETVHLEKEDRP
jgi:hypothetical protein